MVLNFITIENWIFMPDATTIILFIEFKLSKNCTFIIYRYLYNHKINIYIICTAPWWKHIVSFTKLLKK